MARVRGLARPLRRRPSPRKSAPFSVSSSWGRDIFLVSEQRPRSRDFSRTDCSVRVLPRPWRPSESALRRCCTPNGWIPYLKCEGDGDVVGVVTPLCGVAQVVLHGVQVVEVGVRLRVHQDRGVEEDGEGQVEVEREEGEVKERRSWMVCGWSEDSRTS